ncbi:MAG: flagellar basal body-associated FliL family protein [Hoeflea sp.]|uniref:flagellar basal body-associated FliL family protein n=1 Tax=Hoeflea sp. TaxID=1940281 RepID=UPI001DC1CCD0|nr:flagellar basal body-associated FliL family protein [Hoeflea sp.]MBU4531121.1 flagellar basal body-associated FliL family protein [Alphaproteobacteria bacterium]MBU4545817.1 flagellar basal body-associated FliL family protein [Alphaproteobacteria bacterium]MBU4550786.1 flagellar basal body-associated FliL family protein [Alphaproteobacteria bacterium]MBV1724398.1 flagellar basal body-associated FliL family protein [Hoeflea sp.]MBV1760418.1 flagellar basal body-associated FliL family protein
MADDDDNAAKGKGKSGLIATIAIVLVLSLIAAGGGWMLGGILAPQLDQPEETAAVAAEGAAGEAKGEGEIIMRENLVPLEPIMTNLSYPSDNWIRIEVSLVFTGNPDNVLADQIHQDILAYLRTVSLQQIEGPRGFQYLREDLRERVQLRSEGRVNDLLLRTFVIE